MTRLGILLAHAVFILSTLAPCFVSAQEPVSGTIARRLGQALWPEVLFDSAGHPDPRARVRAFRGDPRTGFEASRIGTVKDFPGVEVFRGSAFRCYDCRGSMVAVLVHGADTVTVIEPDDLALALAWLGETLPVADSARIRRAVLGLLNATCLIGCNARQIDDVADVPTGILGFRWIKGEKPLTVPEPRIGPNGSFSEYRLCVLTGWGVYEVIVLWAPRGNYQIHTTALAQIHLM